MWWTFCSVTAGHRTWQKFPCVSCPATSFTHQQWCENFLCGHPAMLAVDSSRASILKGPVTAAPQQNTSLTPVNHNQHCTPKEKSASRSPSHASFKHTAELLWYIAFYYTTAVRCYSIDSLWSSQRINFMDHCTSYHGAQKNPGCSGRCEQGPGTLKVWMLVIFLYCHAACKCVCVCVRGGRSAAAE